MAMCNICTALRAQGVHLMPPHPKVFGENEMMSITLQKDAMTYVLALSGLGIAVFENQADLIADALEGCDVLHAGLTDDERNNALMTVHKALTTLREAMYTKYPDTKPHA